MELNMDEVLKEIGWKNGFHIPMANKENQGLIAEFQKLMNKKQTAKRDFENAKNKFNACEKHLKFIQEECDQNQKLLTDYDRQIKTEQHKYLKVKGEYEKSEQDTNNVKKHIEEITIRNIDKKNELSRIMNRIEKAKVVSKLDLEALKATEECINNKVNDENLLKKYSEVDERKLIKLEARRKILQTSVNEKLEQVEKIDAAIKNYYCMQDKTETILREQENERKLLIERWQNAVKNLRKRDEEIFILKNDIYRAEGYIKEHEQKFNEEESFLRQQINLHKETENEITELNVLHSRTRKELNDAVTFVLDLNTDLNTTKTALLAASTDLENARKEYKKYNDQLERINTSTKKTIANIQDLEIKLTKVKSKSSTATDRAQHFKDLIRYEEMFYIMLTNDIKKSHDILYRSRDSLKEHKDESTRIKLQAPKILIEIRDTKHKITNVMATINLQSEINYRLAFQKYQIEVKIAVYEGTEGGQEDKIISEEKIADLQTSLVKHQEKNTFLKRQVFKVEDEMRKLTAHKTVDAKKLDHLKNKLQDETMIFEGGVKQTAIIKLRLQKTQVDMNMLQFRVSQLEKALSKEDENIYDLHRYKLILETSLKEREIEIDAHRQILEASKKNLEESRSRLKADINWKKNRITQFQKKHHLALGALGSCDDGEPFTMEEFKIKNEEEQKLLKNEHDDLKQKIKTSEKELIAMENTLGVVNKTNNVFLKTLMPKDYDLDRTESEIMKMEEETLKIFDVVKKLKKVFRGKQKKLNDLQNKLEIIREEWQTALKSLEKLESVHLNLKHEEVVYDEKIAKTVNNLKAYKRRIKSNKSSPKTLRNLEIKQLTNGNKEAFRILRNFANENEAQSLVIEDLLSENNLNLPSLDNKSIISVSSSSHSLPVINERIFPKPSTATLTFSLTQVVLNFDNNSK